MMKLGDHQVPGSNFFWMADLSENQMKAVDSSRKAHTSVDAIFCVHGFVLT
jgi:hypothetical protein